MSGIFEMVQILVTGHSDLTLIDFGMLDLNMQSESRYDLRSYKMNIDNLS